MFLEQANPGAEGKLMIRESTLMYHEDPCLGDEENVLVLLTVCSKVCSHHFPLVLTCRCERAV
jgi:hypothetical protein